MLGDTTFGLLSSAVLPFLLRRLSFDEAAVPPSRVDIFDAVDAIFSLHVHSNEVRRVLWTLWYASVSLALLLCSLHTTATSF